MRNVLSRQADHLKTNCKKFCNFWWTNIILSIWQKNFFNPIWVQDSRFKAQKKKLLQSNLFGFKIQDSRLRKNFFNPTSLGLESWILPLCIQEIFFLWDLESWILKDPTPPTLDSRSLLGGSWILNLGSDVLREGWDGNKIANNCNFWSQKMP